MKYISQSIIITIYVMVYFIWSLFVARYVIRHKCFDYISAIWLVLTAIVMFSWTLWAFN